MAKLKDTTINDTGFLKLPVVSTANRPELANGKIQWNTDTNKLDIGVPEGWRSLRSGLNELESGFNGLAGKFFNGDWRSIISTGNIGTLPLTTADNSSNVNITTGKNLPTPEHRGGVRLWPYIDYGNDLGDNYGFIAIGYFRPPTTGTYTIFTASDDGSGVWIGDLALPNQTRTAGNATLNNNLGGGQGVTERSATINLTGGVWYPIRIVHEEVGGGDALRFSWAGPGITKNQSLSQGFFKHPTGPNNNLLGNFLGF